jgi:hypothetical protein
MQPEVIRVAHRDGQYAVQALISFLRGAIQNCCLLEFEDFRTQAAIEACLAAFPEDFDRKVLKSLFVTLQKRNRFLYALTPDYNGVQSDLAVVLARAHALEVDLLLLETVVGVANLPADIESTELGTYQNTNFEHERFRLAGDGKALAEGEHQAVDYLNRYWSKVFRYASRIEVCDRIFGQLFGDNFEYSAKILLRWLEAVLTNPAKCSMVIHVGIPQKATIQHIRSQLTAFRQGHLVGMPIEIHIYDVPNGDQCLPHERFIVTDQVAIQIGRGMDFLDRTTHAIRDISLNYKSPQEVENLLKSYAPYRQQTVKF